MYTGAPKRRRTAMRNSGGEEGVGSVPAHFPEPPVVGSGRPEVTEEGHFLDIPSFQELPLDAREEAAGRDVSQQGLQSRFNVWAFIVLAARRGKDAG